MDGWRWYQPPCPSLYYSIFLNTMILAEHIFVQVNKSQQKIRTNTKQKSQDNEHEHCPFNKLTTPRIYLVTLWRGLVLGLLLLLLQCWIQNQLMSYIICIYISVTGGISLQNTVPLMFNCTIHWAIWKSSCSAIKNQRASCKSYREKIIRKAWRAISYIPLSNQKAVQLAIQGSCYALMLSLFYHTVKLFYDHLWIESKFICFLCRLLKNILASVTSAQSKKQLGRKETQVYWKITK